MDSQEKKRQHRDDNVSMTVDRSFMDIAPDVQHIFEFVPFDWRVVSTAFRQYIAGNIERTLVVTIDQSKSSMCPNEIPYSDSDESESDADTDDSASDYDALRAIGQVLPAIAPAKRVAPSLLSGLKGHVKFQCARTYQYSMFEDLNALQVEYKGARRRCPPVQWQWVYGVATDLRNAVSVTLDFSAL